MGRPCLLPDHPQTGWGWHLDPGGERRKQARLPVDLKNDDLPAILVGGQQPVAGGVQGEIAGFLA